MKRIIIFALIISMLVPIGSLSFAETDGANSQPQMIRSSLNILIDTPTNLVYTYEYQGSLYKNAETINGNLITTLIYKYNSMTQEYEIYHTASTNTNDLNLSGEKKDIDLRTSPNNVDPRTLAYRFAFTSSGSTRILNMTLAAIRAAVAGLIPGGTTQTVAIIANAFYSAGVSNMYYSYVAYREITDNHPVWYREVRRWYLDSNHNNHVDTTTTYYQWWD